MIWVLIGVGVLTGPFAEVDIERLPWAEVEIENLLEIEGMSEDLAARVLAFGRENGIDHFENLLEVEGMNESILSRLERRFIIGRKTTRVRLWGHHALARDAIGVSHRSGARLVAQKIAGGLRSEIRFRWRRSPSLGSGRWREHFRTWFSIRGSALSLYAGDLEPRAGTGLIWGGSFGASVVRGRPGESFQRLRAVPYSGSLPGVRGWGLALEGGQTRLACTWARGTEPGDPDWDQEFLWAGLWAERGRNRFYVLCGKLPHWGGSIVGASGIETMAGSSTVRFEVLTHLARSPIRPEVAWRLHWKPRVNRVWGGLAIFSLPRGVGIPGRTIPLDPGPDRVVRTGLLLYQKTEVGGWWRVWANLLLTTREPDILSRLSKRSWRWEVGARRRGHRIFFNLSREGSSTGPSAGAGILGRTDRSSVILESRMPGKDRLTLFGKGRFSRSGTDLLAGARGDRRLGVRARLKWGLAVFRSRTSNWVVYHSVGTGFYPFRSLGGAGAHAWIALDLETTLGTLGIWCDEVSGEMATTTWGLQGSVELGSELEPELHR